MSAFGGIFQGVHVLIAMRRNEQHWLLSDGEAKLYGERLGAVLRHFPVQVTQKWADITAFIITVGTIEAPRIGQSAQLAAERRNEARRRAQGGNGAWQPPVIQPGIAPADSDLPL